MEESRGEDEPKVTGRTRIVMLGVGLFLFLFGLPFAAGGVFTLLDGLDVLPGSYGFDPFLICFSLPFLGVGLAFIAGGVKMVVGGVLGKDMGLRIGGDDDDEDDDGVHDREHHGSGRSNTAFAYPSREALLAQIHGTPSTDATPSVKQVQNEAASTSKEISEAVEGGETSPAEVSPDEESSTGDGGFWDLSKNT